MFSTAFVWAAAAALALSTTANADTPIASNAVLISIDGWHYGDLSWYAAAYPNSSIAQLARTGNVFTNNWGSLPSDSFPGLANIITGGTPRSHGFYYDKQWSRNLYSNGDDKCAGKLGGSIAYDESVDINGTDITAGCYSTLFGNGCGINETLLPHKKVGTQCIPWYPHDEIRVNTMFEVAKAAGFFTAWADKNPAYEFVNGPSGEGVDDLYTPEIHSAAVPSAANYSQYDELHISAVINWINGKDHLGNPQPKGKKGFVVGCNLQGVSGVQKLNTGGYVNGTFTPSPQLLNAFQIADRQLGNIINAIKGRGLFNSTLLIVAAKHGQSPVDSSKLTKVDDTYLNQIINGALPAAYQVNLTQTSSSYYSISDDDAAYIWLQKPEFSPAVYAALMAADQPKIGILSAGSGFIYAGEDLYELFGVDPFTDSKVPDIAIRSSPGVVYTTSKTKIAEHGGFAENSRHTGLVIAGANINATVIASRVETRQIAPTILKALGADPKGLQAVVAEKTKVLPLA